MDNMLNVGRSGISEPLNRDNLLYVLAQIQQSRIPATIFSNIFVSCIDAE